MPTMLRWEEDLASLDVILPEHRFKLINSFPNVRYYFSVHLWLGEITFTVLLPSNQPEKLTLDLHWRCTVLTYVSCWSKTLLEFPALCSNWSLFFTQSNSVSLNATLSVLALHKYERTLTVMIHEEHTFQGHLTFEESDI